VTRHSSQAAEILPDINRIWNGLAEIWGESRLDQLLRISVFVTDKDSASVAMLQNEIRETSLYKKGMVHFGRPDFHKIIEDHSLEMISTRRSSYSLLAFCGSPALAKSINKSKITNDMLLAMTGNKKHQMEFVSEAYGGSSPSRSTTGRQMSRERRETVAIEEAPHDVLTTHLQLRSNVGVDLNPSTEVFVD